MIPLTLLYRGKLRDLLPSTSFSGGVYLNDTGYNLLTQFLTMDPKQVTGHTDLCFLSSSTPTSFSILLNFLLMYHLGIFAIFCLSDHLI
jgi:hypothetical protein